MRQRIVTIAVVLVGVCGVGVVPAGAGGRPPGAYVGPTGDPTASAGDGASTAPGSAQGGGSSSGAPDPCEWAVVVDDDFVFPVYSEDGGSRQHSRTGRWLQKLCPGVGAVDIGGFFTVPEGGLVDPRQLALDALSSVAIAAPAVQTSPSQNGRLFVQMPTWLWLDAGWWHTYEATANAGRVSSTVRATPVAATWSLGDGNTVACRGAGTAWRLGLAESASDCTYTYRTSSATRPDGHFPLAATVLFNVTWTSNAAAGGALAPITRTSTLQVEVGEIQAIGTGGRK